MKKGTILLFTIVLLLSSCKKDENKESILGAWNCEELSDFGQRNYQVNITRNKYFPNESNEYVIFNFNNIGFSEDTEVYVREEEAGILTITGSSALHVYFIGSGIISDDFSRIEWDYIVNDGVTNHSVVANYY